MAGDETRCRAAGGWPDAGTDAISKKTSIAAGLSLGVFLLALESERLATLVHVEGHSGASPVFTTLLALGVLAVCTVALCRRPVGRIAPLTCPLLAALACSLGMATMFYLRGAAFGIARDVGDLLRAVASVALLYFWVQRAAPFGRAFVVTGFGVGAVVLGCLNMLTMVFEHTVALVIVALLPFVGVALLAMVDVGEAPAGAGGRAPAGAGAPACAGAGRWSALRAVAGRDGGPAEGPITRVVGRALLKLVPFLCYAVIFGNVHFSWVGLQDGGLVSTWVQLGASVGSILCGLAALCLARLHWGRAFESIVHLLLTAFALVALWLSTFLTSGYVFAYLVLLNIAQKLAFLLMLMFGFSFARDARSYVSLWALAYFSFHAGTCASFLVGTVQSVGVLNAVAAGALAARPGFEASVPYACHLIATEYDLTRREEEILQLLVRGRTAARIAETLCITTATTRTHLRNIYAKLGVHSQQDILDLFEEYSARGV